MARRQLGRFIAVAVAGASMLLGLTAACSQQGRGDGVDAKPVAWKQTVLAPGLEHPWSLAFLPNGDMLVTERPGRLRLVRGGQLVQQPIEGVPQVLAVNQGGLMDVEIHPDFGQNQFVYFTYSSGTPEANRTVLARGRLDGMQLRDVQELFRADPDKPGDEHFGSVLLWLPDGTLLMSVGDGGNPPLQVGGTLARENGQRLDRHLGKILRLDANGKPPRDNPFVGREGVRPEIYSYGHRNIQGLARERRSGRVWATEHGPFGGDEVNLITPGGNYGWPRASTGLDYTTKERVTPNDSLPSMIDPKFTWSPSKAPSGLAFYTGDRFGAWRGDLFSGGLVTQAVHRLKLDGENVTGEEKLAIGRRVREVVQGPDGLLYVLTDHDDGELLRIEPAK